MIKCARCGKKLSNEKAEYMDGKPYGKKCFDFVLARRKQFYAKIDEKCSK